MKRTSRFLALLLSAVMLLALAGCGGKDTTPAPQPSDGDAAGEAVVYPADLLNYYVAASAGGGLDIVSRAFTNQWEDALGTTFEYIYEDIVLWLMCAATLLMPKLISRRTAKKGVESK